MKKTKKFSRKFSLLTIFMLFMSIITMNVYAAKLPFTDVPEKAWYYDDVKSAYESDLISGKKPTKYAPNDNMTAAEAVKLAAAMYKLRNEGSANFATSKPWYKVYVDYARQKALISSDLNWNKNITRAGYMQIFANILTDEEAKKNSVADDSIPDVPMTHPNAQAIYKLYRAGIVTGVDERNSCSPGSNIKRSEVAAILIRIMDAKYRVTFSLGDTTPPADTTPPIATPQPEVKPLVIAKNPRNVTGQLGVTVLLDVQAEGGKEPYNYQWEERKFGDREYTNSSAEGSNTNILKPNIQNFLCDYRCVITDANGNKVTSEAARVEKEPLKPKLVIIKQPDNAKGKLGELVSLEVQVTGGVEPYSYQWQRRLFRGLDYTISNAEGNTTNILKPKAGIGAYYRCVITDANGDRVTSIPVKVETDEFNTPLKITKEPDVVRGKVGDKVELEVQAEGGKKPYRYRWEFAISLVDSSFRDCTEEGSTTNILRPTVTENACNYVCIVTDSEGHSVRCNQIMVIREK
ncbi:SLH domain protein [Peptostreptococcaceae bacterium AS15]|nr:SLH domain protein [Peptostreptococcaceae bacterium AS15]